VWAVLVHGARRRDMVGRYRVAELRQHTCPFQFARLPWSLRHVLEVWRFPHVGRLTMPLEQFAFRHWHRLPALIAFRGLAVFLLEHLRPYRLVHHRLDFLGRRPDVFQIYWLTLRIVSQRLRV